MSFATEIAKDRSHRYTLVRMTPARYVGGDLASEGGGIYGMSFPYPIASIERNGVALTEDAAAPSVNDHWYHDEATGELDVKLASAPDADTNVIVVFYYLFYSSHPVSTYETPTDSATPMRPWEPRLASDPTFNHGISDVFYGVFTVQPSSFDLTNTDNAFQAFLGSDDSLNNKAVDVWIVVNDQVDKAFNGLVKSLSVDPARVTVQVLDEFEKLSQPAFMGDTVYEAIYKVDASGFPDMDPSKDGTPCPFIFGKNRHTWLEQQWTAFNALSDRKWTRYLHPELSASAVCIDYQSFTQGNLNRSWSLCRVPSDGLKTLDFGSITNIMYGRGLGIGYTVGSFHEIHGGIRITHTGHNLEIGDSFSFTHASAAGGATLYAVVMEFVAGDVTICMVGNTNTGVPGTSIDITSAVITGNSAPALCVYDPSVPYGYPLYYGLDFTYTTTATEGGNLRVDIELVSSFEDAGTYEGGAAKVHRELTTVSPDSHTLLYRVTPASAAPTAHGDVVQTILEAAGLAVDSASISGANSDLDADVSMMIPRHDETEYRSYREYLQEILRSTMGIIKVNATDGEAEYFLAEAPSATDEIDDNMILGEPPSVAIDYRDIATEIIASNPNLPSGITAATAVVAANAKAKYLHGVDQKLQMEHALEDISGRIETILAVYAARRAVYKFKVATSLLQATIGDDVTLTTSTLLGGEASRDMKIISLSKSASDVEVEVTDLEGL
jgi:hypothetical protein